MRIILYFAYFVTGAKKKQAKMLHPPGIKNDGNICFALIITHKKYFHIVQCNNCSYNSRKVTTELFVEVHEVVKVSMLNDITKKIIIF